MTIDAPCYPRPFEINQSHYDAARAFLEGLSAQKFSRKDLFELLAKGYATADELIALRPFVKF